MSNEVMIFRSNRKKGGFCCSVERRSCLQRVMVSNTGKEEVEVGTLLLSSDKNNVIAENVLSYF